MPPATIWTPSSWRGTDYWTMVARHAHQAGPPPSSYEGNAALYDGPGCPWNLLAPASCQIFGHARGVGGGLHHARPAPPPANGAGVPSHFDPEVPIRGVVLNQIARPRHETLFAMPSSAIAAFRYGSDPAPQSVRSFLNATWAWCPRRSCHSHPGHNTTARDLAQRYLDLDGSGMVEAQAPPLPVTPGSGCSSSPGRNLGDHRGDPGFRL